MTPEQILAAARLAGGTPYTNRHYPDQTAMAFSHSKMIEFAQAIEAATREECAKVVERDLYPEDSQKPYTQHYNSCIKRLAEIIRSGT